MPVNVLCAVFVDTRVSCDFVFPNIFNLQYVFKKICNAGWWIVDSKVLSFNLLYIVFRVIV